MMHLKRKSRNLPQDALAEKIGACKRTLIDIKRKLKILSLKYGVCG